MALGVKTEVLGSIEGKRLGSIERTKPETMVLCRNMVDYSLRVGGVAATSEVV